MDISKIRNPVALEEEGVWIQLPNFPGVRARIRSLASDPVQQARKRALARFRVDLERKGEDEVTVARRDRASACVALRTLRALVVEVEGIKDGEKVLHLDDFADDLFADPPESGGTDDAGRAWRWLRDDLWSVALRFEEEARATLAEAGKGQPTPSEDA